MSSSLKIPSEVFIAAELKFSTPITGFLWQPFPQGWSLAGELYGDLSCRFEEGGMIQTSAIMELRWEHGYALAYTFSDSCYVLVRPVDNWDEKLKKLFIHEAPPRIGGLMRLLPIAEAIALEGQTLSGASPSEIEIIQSLVKETGKAISAVTGWVIIDVIDANSAPIIASGKQPIVMFTHSVL